jgi:hypothetical protein
MDTLEASTTDMQQLSERVAKLEKSVNQLKGMVFKRVKKAT